MNQDFIVFDTPGLSDSRGQDTLTDDDIKDQIELAMLQITETTQNYVNAFLIFESCEEKMTKVNTSFKALKEMFGQDYSLSSICMLTGCSDQSSQKIKARTQSLINLCLENGIDYVIWDPMQEKKRQEWLVQQRDLI